MSKSNHKKRHPQGKRGYTISPAPESEFASDGRRRRMNSTARNLLFLSLICLAASELLLRMEVLPEEVSLVISIVALIALVAALFFQFSRPDGGSHGQPRL